MTNTQANKNNAFPEGRPYSQFPSEPCPNSNTPWPYVFQMKKKTKQKNNKKQEGHDGPVSLTCIALTEPDLKIIMANILTEIHDDYIKE